MKRRDLTPEEQQLWYKLIKDVEKLPKSETTPPDLPNIPRNQAPRRYRDPGPQPLPSITGRKAPEKTTISRKEARRLKIESRLDLHGFSQDQAFQALLRFLKVGFRDGKTWVLVITGKGTTDDLGGLLPHGPHQGKGVLKRAVPAWLQEYPLKDIVSGYTEARQEDGGDGALYIRLKHAIKDGSHT